MEHTLNNSAYFYVFSELSQAVLFVTCDDVSDSQRGNEFLPSWSVCDGGRGSGLAKEHPRPDSPGGVHRKHQGHVLHLNTDTQKSQQCLLLFKSLNCHYIQEAMFLLLILVSDFKLFQSFYKIVNKDLDRLHSLSQFLHTELKAL